MSGWQMWTRNMLGFPFEVVYFGAFYLALSLLLTVCTNLKNEEGEQLSHRRNSCWEGKPLPHRTSLVATLVHLLSSPLLDLVKPFQTDSSQLGCSFGGCDPSPSVGAQRRRQTYTSIFSVWAHHTDAARPSLAAVSRTHRFQAGCARLPMPARSGATVSFRLHPEHHRIQPPPSSVVVILEHFRWLVAASGTVCRLTLPQLQRWLFFRNRLKTFLFSQSYPN